MEDELVVQFSRGFVKDKPSRVFPQFTSQRNEQRKQKKIHNMVTYNRQLYVQTTKQKLYKVGRMSEYSSLGIRVGGG